jgi:hypothetical protein
MPYTSDAQRRWAHTEAGTKALGGPAKVKEWDRASKGKDLPMYSKGSKPKDAAYAQGGPVITTRSRFLKTPDVFRTDTETNEYGKSGKGGELSKTEGDTKAQKAIKPRG